MKQERTVPAREQIPESCRWDLSPLFKDDAEWEDRFRSLERDLPEYGQFRGQLALSAARLERALRFDLGISRRLDRLYTYAHLRNDEDKTHPHHASLFQRALTLSTRVSEESSFLAPEIQAIPPDLMKSFLKEDILKPYEFLLFKILRHRPHTLPVESERILAMTGDLAQSSSQFFSQLDNADLRFGMIQDEEGQSVELSHGNFIRFLMSPTRELRRQAFMQYYGVYEAHKHSLSASLSSSVKKDRFYARVRSFPGCRAAALFQDAVPEAVYDNLLETVRAGLGPLFAYLRFRKEALGLEELHFYDTYTSLVSDLPFRMPYEEAVETCLDALRPLGEEYGNILREGLTGRWVDRYENRGKRSGAYSSGCYDSPPYILMNYREDSINSLYTLIHEAGHSMHSYYSRLSQPYAYHDYTIFAAEVASTFNEILLSRHLLNLYAKDDLRKAYILNREIDNLRGTLFRQSMFAEFEKQIHEDVEQNRPLTLERIQDIYAGLLNTYFGEALVLDRELTLEGLRIPHFYSPFYVYKYATGISAAIALAGRVLEEGETAKERYLAFLRSGGNSYPLDQLRAAGVDMSQPEPVVSAVKYFETLVVRLQENYRPGDTGCS